VSVDAGFERAVLAELVRRERRARLSDGTHDPRALAHRLHRGSHDLLAHLRRVAIAVPKRCRAVAWLHHAGDANVTPRALEAAGLTPDEVAAVELLSAALERPILHCARELSKAPGCAGHLARVVARAAIEDRLRMDGRS
jgi:hypothetical protein